MCPTSRTTTRPDATGWSAISNLWGPITSSSRATQRSPIRRRSARPTGSTPEDSANTIVVIGKSDPPRYAACVTLAPYRLDVNRTVRDRLGTRKASFAPAEDTAAITGMQIGGVTVFGLPPDMPIWVDARVMERERVILGGGSRSWKVISTPSILTSLPRVEVVDGLANEPRPDA